MSSETAPNSWSEFVARLVEDIGRGSQSALARRLGVSPQRVQAWLNADERPSVRLLVKVARATGHSLPYLVAMAYDVPIETMADGAGELLAHDRSLDDRERDHIAQQYVILAELQRIRNRVVHGLDEPPLDESSVDDS